MPKTPEQELITQLQKHVIQLEKRLAELTTNLDKRLAAIEKNVIPGPTLVLKASEVKVQASMLTATGAVKANTVTANTVVAATYAPGVGNVW